MFFNELSFSGGFKGFVRRAAWGWNAVARELFHECDRIAAENSPAGLQQVGQTVREPFLGVVGDEVERTGKNVRRGHVVLNEYSSGIQSVAVISVDRRELVGVAVEDDEAACGDVRPVVIVDEAPARFRAEEQGRLDACVD